jgi:alpha-glucan,water dikinase
MLLLQARGHPDPWVRLYARLALAGLPRGGGNGDDIRMGILHIMREYGIKEGHRPVSGFEIMLFRTITCQ